MNLLQGIQATATLPEGMEIDLTMRAGGFRVQLYDINANFAHALLLERQMDGIVELIAAIREAIELAHEAAKLRDKE